jgi:inorganic phosphate transporter, PiT family
VRAFCVTLSAGITVIIASALGLPVSSTHIAIGALFGVGFLREYLANQDFPTVPVATVLGFSPPPALDNNNDPSAVEKLRRRYLVRRMHLVTIVAAWLITVPASALLAAGLALALNASGLIVLE